MTPLTSFFFTYFSSSFMTSILLSRPFLSSLTFSSLTFSSLILFLSDRVCPSHSHMAFLRLCLPRKRRLPCTLIAPARFTWAGWWAGLITLTFLHRVRIPICTRTPTPPMRPSAPLQVSDIAAVDAIDLFVMSLICLSQARPLG